jgi:hypothetical protein
MPLGRQDNESVWCDQYQKNFRTKWFESIKLLPSLFSIISYVSTLTYFSHMLEISLSVTKLTKPMISFHLYILQIHIIKNFPFNRSRPPLFESTWPFGKFRPNFSVLATPQLYHIRPFMKTPQISSSTNPKGPGGCVPFRKNFDRRGRFGRMNIYYIIPILEYSTRRLILPKRRLVGLDL